MEKKCMQNCISFKILENCLLVKLRPWWVVWVKFTQTGSIQGKQALLIRIILRFWQSYFLFHTTVVDRQSSTTAATMLIVGLPVGLEKQHCMHEHDLAHIVSKY